MSWLKAEFCNNNYWQLTSITNIRWKCQLCSVFNYVLNQNSKQSYCNLESLQKLFASCLSFNVFFCWAEANYDVYKVVGVCSFHFKVLRPVCSPSTLLSGRGMITSNCSLEPASWLAHPKLLIRIIFVLLYHEKAQTEIYFMWNWY